MKKTNKPVKTVSLHYASIIAEVGYNQYIPSPIEGEDSTLVQQSAKVQFFSQSEKAVFPLARMQQLQKNAAEMVINSGINMEDITNVFLTNIIPLGWMTEVEFRTPGQTQIVNAAGPIGVAEAAAADPSAPVTDMLGASVEAAEPAGDNVTPIR